MSIHALGKQNKLLFSIPHTRRTKECILEAIKAGGNKITSFFDFYLTSRQGPKKV